MTYPARFQLVAAMNPSPTGHYQGNHNRCTPDRHYVISTGSRGPFSTASISHWRSHYHPPAF
ncbi:ATP-binding protein [Escherichia coli]